MVVFQPEPGNPLLLAVGNLSSEADFHCFVPLFLFPGVAVSQPAIGKLHLIAIGDFLTEQAVSVAKPVAVARHAQVDHAVQEAGCQPPQSSVADARVLFLLQHRFIIDSQILKAFFDDVFQIQVDQIIFQQPADEELHGKVVNLLFVEPGIFLTGFNPVDVDFFPEQLQQGPVAVCWRGFPREDFPLEFFKNPPEVFGKSFL